MGVEKGCDMYFNLLGLLNLGKRAFALLIGMVICVLGLSPCTKHGAFCRSVVRVGARASFSNKYDFNVGWVFFFWLSEKLMPKSSRFGGFFL